MVTEGPWFSSLLGQADPSCTAVNDAVTRLLGALLRFSNRNVSAGCGQTGALGWPSLPLLVRGQVQCAWAPLAAAAGRRFVLTGLGAGFRGPVAPRPTDVPLLMGRALSWRCGPARAAGSGEAVPH